MWLFTRGYGNILGRFRPGIVLWRSGSRPEGDSGFWRVTCVLRTGNAQPGKGSRHIQNRLNLSDVSLFEKKTTKYLRHEHDFKCSSNKNAASSDSLGSWSPTFSIFSFSDHSVLLRFACMQWNPFENTANWIDCFTSYSNS